MEKENKALEAFIRSLDPSFLIRSMFAGFFFLISLRLPGPIGVLPEFSPFENGLGVTASLSLVLGFAIYTFHRAIFYPFIEWFLQRRISRIFRRKIISDEVVSRLLDKWSLGYSPGWKRVDAQRKMIGPWADSVHFLYASSFAIFGGMVCRFFSGETFLFSVCFVALSFFIAALVSDHRLQAVIEVHVEEGKKMS